MTDKLGTILRINEESIQTKLLARTDAPSFLPAQKRHTLFQQIHREIAPTDAPAFGQTLVFEIPYYGDLLGDAAIRITLPSPTPQNSVAITEAGSSAAFLGPLWGYRNNLGYRLLQQVALQMNGVLIDRHTGESLYLDQALAEKDDGKDRGLNVLIGRQTAGTQVAGTDLVASPLTLFIPLRFWFNKTPRQALPLISLADEKIEVRITLAPVADVMFQNHVAPITIDAEPTPLSFIASPYYKRDGAGVLEIGGFESGGAVTATALTATGPAVATDFQPVSASLWLKQQFLGQEEQSLYGQRVLRYPLLQVARIPDTFTEGTKRVRIPVNTKNPIARIFVALEDVRVTQPLEAGGNLGESFLQTRLTDTGGIPAGYDLTGVGSARMLTGQYLPIERLSLYQESQPRHVQEPQRAYFLEADERGGSLWQVPGAALIAWDEDMKNEGPTGEATMVNLQPEIEICLTDEAAGQNQRVVCFAMTQNIQQIQDGGGALLFEQNG